MLTVIRNILLTSGILYIGSYINALYSGYYHVLSLVTNALIIIAVTIYTLIHNHHTTVKNADFDLKRLDRVKSHPLYNLFLDEDAYRRRIPKHKLPDTFYTWLHLHQDKKELLD